MIWNADKTQLNGVNTKKMQAKEKNGGKPAKE